MKKLLFIIFLISVFESNTNAQEKDFPRWSFGAEWSYVATVDCGWHYNFFSQEGYRVDTRGKNTVFYSNAEAYFNVGYNLTHRWNLALYVGIAGLYDMHKAIPASIRNTFFWGEDPDDDRWFSFIDLGSGICLKKPPQEILTGKIGGGYRISLSRNSKLDFLLSLKMAYTHPEIIYEDAVIPFEKINKNNSYIGAITLGTAITF